MLFLRSLVSFFSHLRSDQRGFTAIEWSLVVAALGASFVGYQAIANKNDTSNNIQIEADQLSWVHGYVVDEINANVTSSTWLTAIQGTPITLAPSDLALPAGFNDSSILGRQIRAVVRSPDGIGVEYYTFFTGGTPMTDDDLATSALRIGALGGAVTNIDPTNITTVGRMNIQAIADFTGAPTLPAVGTPVIFGSIGAGANNNTHASRIDLPGVTDETTFYQEITLDDHDVTGASEFRATGVADGQGINAAKTSTLTNLDGSSVSGTAAVDATPNTIAHRDASGRMKVEAPADPKDVVNLETLQAAAGGSGGPTWSADIGYTGNYWAPLGTTAVHEITKGIPGDKVINCHINNSATLYFHNTGQHYYVKVNVYVYNEASTIATAIIANHLLGSVSTRAYATNSSDAVSFTGLSLPDGSYLRINFNGTGEIGATIACSYTVL